MRKCCREPEGCPTSIKYQGRNVRRERAGQLTSGRGPVVGVQNIEHRSPRAGRLRCQARLAGRPSPAGMPNEQRWVESTFLAGARRHTTRAASGVAYEIYREASRQVN